ncbi:hypothetical protein [Gymnodinialimonas sp.]
MQQYQWRVSLAQGRQSVRLSPQGIWIGERVYPWADLRDVGFVRYQTRQGANEELALTFEDGTKRILQWTGAWHQRAAWREMLVALAQMAARKRPDLDLRDGPDAQQQAAARSIGLGVTGVALAIAAVVFLASEAVVGVLVAAWIGGVGGGVGLLIFRHYSRRGPSPRLDWASFAAREGQEGHLPAN